VLRLRDGRRRRGLLEQALDEAQVVGQQLGDGVLRLLGPFPFVVDKSLLGHFCFFFFFDIWRLSF
jgi:hypothetical protein